MAIQTGQELQFEKDIEAYKDRLERDRNAASHWEAVQLVGYKGILTFAIGATRGALILNGAGAIALMTFIGSARATEWQSSMLAAALATFAIGALFAVLCGGASYISQSFFTAMAAQRQLSSRMGTSFQCIGLAFFVSSVFYFVLGLWRAAKVFGLDFSLWSILWP